MSYSRKKIDALFGLMESNDSICEIIDWLSKRERNPRNGKTTVKALSRELRAFTELEISESLQSIASIGFGTYRLGRSLKDAFIVWEGNPVEIPQEIAKYKQGHISTSKRDGIAHMNSINEGKEQEPVELETHDFPVRPGVKLPIQIRLDMSGQELENMADYIRIIARSRLPSTQP